MCGGSDRAVTEGDGLFDRVGEPVLPEHTVAEQIEHFEERTPGDAHKLRELTMPIAPESFSDVARGRTGRVADLIAEFPVVRRTSGGSHCVHPHADLIRKLPNNQTFDTLRAHTRFAQHTPYHSQHPSTQAPEAPTHDGYPSTGHPSAPAPTHLKHLKPPS